MKTQFLFGLLAMLVLALPLNIAAQTCVEPPSGLVSWWPAEGTADDASGNNDGSLQGGAGFDTGIVGSAFNLDGFFDYILVPDDPSLNLERITIEGWVRTSAPDNLFVVSKSGTTGLYGYEVGAHPSGVGRFLLNGATGGADVLGASTITDGLFHHIAVTYDGHYLELYVDGVHESQRFIRTTIDYQPGSQVVIGAREFPALPGFWNGAIDELSVYSRGLCSTEIEAIYNAGSAGKCFGGMVTGCSIFLDDFESGNTGMWSTTSP